MRHQEVKERPCAAESLNCLSHTHTHTHTLAHTDTLLRTHKDTDIHTNTHTQTQALIINLFLMGRPQIKSLTY